MATNLGRQFAATLAHELYERIVAVGYDLKARGEFPETPEDLAHVAVCAGLDALAEGVRELNQQLGLHPDDPRRERPETLLPA